MEFPDFTCAKEAEYTSDEEWRAEGGKKGVWELVVKRLG